MAQPKAQFGKIIQVHDGEVHRYHRRKDGRSVVYTVCCSCGLTHLEEFLPRKTYMRVRVWRDESRTREMRKRRKRATR